MRILAKRDLNNDGVKNDAVDARWRVNGGPVQSASTSEWNGGEVFGGRVTCTTGSCAGPSPGSTTATPWRCGSPAAASGATRSRSLWRRAGEPGPGAHPGRRGLLWRGDRPRLSRRGAAGLPELTTRLPDGAGRSWDVYDVDAMGASIRITSGCSPLRRRDLVHGQRLPDPGAGQVAGTGASTLANRDAHVRSFLNEAGKLLYTGRHAGWQFANAFPYNPVGTPPFCDDREPEADDECLLLSDDFMQYWLGAYLFLEDGGTNAGDRRLPHHGTETHTRGRPGPCGGTEPGRSDQPVRGAPDAVVLHDQQPPETQRPIRSSPAGLPPSGTRASSGRVQSPHGHPVRLLRSSRYPLPAPDEHVHGDAGTMICHS